MSGYRGGYRIRGRLGGRLGYIFSKSTYPHCERDIPNNVFKRHVDGCAKLEPLEREARKKLAEKRKHA